jgi:hypothetical protein
MNITKSYSSLITQHNVAIAQFAGQIRYQESLTEPDNGLIHDLKALYETEKQRLVEAWEKVKAKGVEFLQAVFGIVKEFFEELVSDIVAFLKRHKLSEIIELIKEIF